jgi:hypothetical protein
MCLTSDTIMRVNKFASAFSSVQLMCVGGILIALLGGGGGVLFFTCRIYAARSLLLLVCDDSQHIGFRLRL